MELDNSRIEIASKRRNTRHLIIRHGHDDVFRLEPLAPGRHDEPIAFLPKPIDLGSISYRQHKTLRIVRQLSSHLILRGKAVAARRESQARESGVTRGIEEPKRVPTVPPRITNPLVCIQNQKRQMAFGQMVSDCESRLPATDDDSFNSLRVVTVFHFLHLTNIYRRRKDRAAQRTPHRSEYSILTFAGMGNFV